MSGKKYLDLQGLAKFLTHLRETFSHKDHTHDERYYTESEIDYKLDGKSNSNHTHTIPNATQSSSGFMSATDKVKLDNIENGAQVNQNAFSNVYINGTTLSADLKTDTLTLIAGSNVTLAPNATNDSITISSNNTIYTHPTTSGNKHIPSGGSSGQILRWSSDGTAAWGSDNNTTYSAGTGISLSGTTFSNSGVRSIATGSSNGTISVNTGGTVANVAVKGLGTAAYTASSAYAPASHTHNYAASSSAGGSANQANTMKPVTTSGTGAAYTATVSGITSLTAGINFIMLPHVTSTSASPTLNVNGLGAKPIAQRVTNSTSQSTSLLSSAFLTVNKPVIVIYDGINWVIDVSRVSPDSIYGQIPATKTNVTVDSTIKNLQDAWNSLSPISFKDSVQFSEGYVNVHFVLHSGMVFISYQGEGKTHTAGTLLFTVPAGYRPKSQVLCPFVKNTTAYGVIAITTDGKCSVNQISSTTASGRIYFQMNYPI